MKPYYTLLLLFFHYYVLSISIHLSIDYYSDMFVLQKFE